MTRYRILTYQGSEDWITYTLERGAVPATGCHKLGNMNNQINSVTFGAATSWGLGLWLATLIKLAQFKSWCGKWVF